MSLHRYGAAGLDRRRVLALTAATAASPALAADQAAGLTIVNALGGLIDPNLPEPPRAAMTPRILADARASGLTAVNVTVGFVAGPEEPFQATVAGVAQWDRLIRQHPGDLTKVLSAADIGRAKAARKIGVILGLQNAAMMGDDPARVDIFADLGVRVIQLTYNIANQLGDGAMAAQGRGLTGFGRQVVERLNANRVMVDLSHSGRQICLDAAQASKQPVSINHTGCRALVDLPRNKSDEELRLVAEKGGFVGVYFMPFISRTGHATAADVVAHIEHALNVCGEDQVGLGTDGGTTPIDDLEAYRLVYAKEHEERVAQGIAAAGEGPEAFPFVEDLRGVDQFRKLCRLLAARGHKSARIEKIMGRNFVRYAREVWGG